MSRVLLLDTSFSSAPIFQALQDIGAEVHVVGARPDDFLANCAENYQQLDYSKVGEVAAYIRTAGFDYILPGCNDVSYNVCAELSREFSGIHTDEPSAVGVLHDKSSFRKFLSENHLSSPSVIDSEDVSNYAAVVIKPTDAYSGRGVRVLNEKDYHLLGDCIENARQHSKSGNYLIEEFIPGKLFSHSAFLYKRKIVMDFMVEEHCLFNPFAVDTSWVARDFPSKMLDQIRSEIEIIAHALNLKDGLIHTQLILNREKFALVEITRRCPGDLYSMLIRFSTGYDYAGNYARSLMGMAPAITPANPAETHMVRHTVNRRSGMFYGSIKFAQSARVESYIPLVEAGKIASSSASTRIGVAFLRAESCCELEEIVTKIATDHLYSVECAIC